MAVFCAIPPLDQAATRIGRGYGRGYNRTRTVRDQLHGGMDFVADSGTPVLAPIPGTVVLVSTDSGPGRVRGMGGYGNAVVLEHRFAVAGLPNPFWTSYNHLRSVPVLSVGTRVNTGDLIGQVGNTTNGQFPGMGAHLHFEVRRRPFPGSYDNDTVDPAILFRGMGIDVVGGRREIERHVGGQLLVRAGGESDCTAGLRPTIAGWNARAVVNGWEATLSHYGLRDVPTGYVDPATLRSKYAEKGVSRSNQNVENVLPPEYDPSTDNTRPRPGTASSSGGGGVLVIGAGVLLAGALLFRGGR